MWMLVVSYIVGTIIVGMLADRYRRSVGAWIALSIVISPLIAGLILLASGPSAATNRFHSDGSLAGIPYRWQPDWSIDAVMPGGTVRFKTLDHFIAAVPHAGEAADNLRRERVRRAVEKLRQAKRQRQSFEFFAVVVIALGKIAMGRIRD